MMSGTMILGGDSPGVTRAGVRTGPGLEFLPGVLIDMHFAERGRLNRLLSAVALYPHELGLGIDEDTAILADGDCFEVLGTGAVTVVDAGAASDIRVAGRRADRPRPARASTCCPPGAGSSCPAAARARRRPPAPGNGEQAA